MSRFLKQNSKRLLGFVAFFPRLYNLSQIQKVWLTRKKYMCSFWNTSFWRLPYTPAFCLHCRQQFLSTVQSKVMLISCFLWGQGLYFYVLTYPFKPLTLGNAHNNTLACLCNAYWLRCGNITRGFVGECDTQALGEGACMAQSLFCLIFFFLGVWKARKGKGRVTYLYCRRVSRRSCFCHC